MRKWMSFLIAYAVLSGCTHELPEPESIVKAEGMTGGQNERVEKPFIRHSVKGRTLFIESYIPGHSFAENIKMVLVIDGQPHGEYRTAAFVVKNLPKGNHRYKVDVQKTDGQPMGISKEFTYTVY